ncbi:MAG: glycoside hydrolase family 92 protein, partial [bacterium]|nr:glycoside hydrolase family 92 protein [bacterium]
KEQIVAKVGISFVDEAGARMNLEKEAPRWDFDLYRRGAEERWEEELSRIEVTSADETAKTIFYTGLYHTMISPTVSSDIEGEQASPDITGMMGQYAHGNEPSHQTAHIYNLIGQPWKTQELVDEILCRLYLATPDGISGNEDCGQMSAWYVLNSMGFFSYCPGIPEYSIGRPLFNEVKIRLQNGKQFAIKATDNSRNNKYVQSATLNGKILSSPFFSHQELLNGGVLELQMDSIPNVRWGSRD